MTAFQAAKYWARFFVTLLVPLLLLGVAASSATVARDAESLESNRQRVLAYLLAQQLTQNHYRDQSLDDRFSASAFDLYLQQLDSQKRFLLQGDVARLREFEQQIDNELRSGYLQLPQVSSDLHRQRIDEVEKLIQEIMAEGFDFRRDESLETDPDKLAYCRTLAELRHRWRKILKYQVLNRYLEFHEEQEGGASISAGMPAGYRMDREQLSAARDKVAKSMDQLLRRLRQITRREYVDRYFDAICRAFDPHTNYLAPEENEEFEISMKGSLEGIGATLQQVDGFIKVVSIVPGSPAARQGQLQAEDIILKVAEGRNEPIDIVDARLRDAVRLIRGKKGTEVRLTVRKPRGGQQVIPIVRDIVQIQESFVRSTLLTGSEGRGGAFGYIRIPTFYRDFFDDRKDGKPRNCTDDVRAALQKLATQQVDGLIVDLRNNGGGALTDAVQIAGLFIDQGPVVQVRDSSGRVAVLADTDPSVAYRGPVVLLVNRFSASASEILAAALQDYRRALVVGDHATHGKGTVQTVLDLDRALLPGAMDRYRPLGAMKLTVQKFYRVSGGSTQVQGVEPDLLLPDPLPFVESGERYADYALPWDTIAPASFIPWQQTPFDFAGLRASSRERLEHSSRFQVLAEQRKRSQERGSNSLRPLKLNDLWHDLRLARAALQEETPSPADEGAAQGIRADDSAWAEQVEQDLFVGEAMQVLADLNRSQAAAAAMARAADGGL